MSNEKLLEKSSKEGDLKREIYEESKKIWRVGLPSVISKVTSFGSLVVTQYFIGHISSSSVDLAGYALIQTLAVRFVFGVLLGMSSATETLCGQAYGAKQYHMMGIFLQRSWLIDLVSMTIVLPVFLFGGPIFKMVGEDPSVSDSAGLIALWFIPYLYSWVFSLTIHKYLQAQQRNQIVAYLSMLQFLGNILLSWAFVQILAWGVSGAMLALNISNWLLVFGEFYYIFGGWCHDTWKGFSLSTFNDIFPMVRLSISSGIMVCVEVWYSAILVLLATYTKDAEVSISAFSICININLWEFMISVGLLEAACVRVANELGRGNAKAVRFSIRVFIYTSLLIAVTLSMLCLIFGNKIGYLFTDKEDVAKMVGSLSTILAFAVLFNSIYPVLSGVAVGAGLQGIVAIINIICFYLIGLPIGILLGYVVGLQVQGIWIGMLCGIITETIALSFMMWRTNWDKEVQKTAVSLNRWYLESPDEVLHRSDQA